MKNNVVIVTDAIVGIGRLKSESGNCKVTLRFDFHRSHVTINTIAEI
jgi:hypothetical protein